MPADLRAPTPPTTLPRARSRVLPVLALVTLLYLGIDMALFGLFSASVGRIGPSADALQVPAAEVAAVVRASAAADARLGAAHRVAAWRLGLQVGEAAQSVGLALTQPALWQQRLAAAQAQVLAAGHDQTLGVAPAALIAPRQWADFSNLPRLVESDANGLAARIEAAASPRHRHLYQAGALLGGHAWALRQGLASTAPAAPEAIARHLALAGLPRALWLPLLAPPQGGSAAARAGALDARLAAIEAMLLQ